MRSMKSAALTMLATALLTAGCSQRHQVSHNSPEPARNSVGQAENAAEHARAASSPVALPYARPVLNGHCSVLGNSYSLSLSNPGQSPIDLTGFSVVFTQYGQETGSDDEPGAGYINGVNPFGLSDWILPGYRVVLNVQPFSAMPSADACTIVQWTY